jgi:hypothetical protein
MMFDADFRALSDDDLAALADRMAVPERYLPLLQHLRDADISAESALKSALRDHDKDYLRETDARESLRLKMEQAGMFGKQAERAWAQVGDAIHERAMASRPSRKSYEVHLEVEVSRDAFLVALHKTGDVDAAAATAIARGLPLALDLPANSPTP